MIQRSRTGAYPVRDLSSYAVLSGGAMPGRNGIAQLLIKRYPCDMMTTKRRGPRLTLREAKRVIQYAWKRVSVDAEGF